MIRHSCQSQEIDTAYEISSGLLIRSCFGFYGNLYEKMVNVA